MHSSCICTFDTDFQKAKGTNMQALSNIPKNASLAWYEPDGRYRQALLAINDEPRRMAYVEYFGGSRNATTATIYSADRTRVLMQNISSSNGSLTWGAYWHGLLCKLAPPNFTVVNSKIGSSTSGYFMITNVGANFLA